MTWRVEYACSRVKTRCSHSEDLRLTRAVTTSYHGHVK
jgi:hypothetical protein